MRTSQTSSFVNVEIITALPEHEPILSNLLELYVYDFSAMLNIDLGADGRFGYAQLPLYWKEPGRHPFLVKIDGHLAGFVFLRQGSQISGDADIWDVTEFFIVRCYRRLGIGLKVAHDIWTRFPGKWEVRVIDRNSKAKEFWAHAIRQFISQTIYPTPFKRNGEGWHVFSFETGSAA